MQAIGWQPQRAPDGAPLDDERSRPEQTTMHRLVQQHMAVFVAQTEASTGAELPRFIKDKSDAFAECSILADGSLWLRCGQRGHEKLLRSAASAAGSTRHAVRGGCRRRQRAWWAM